jgi:transposase-like protein
MRRASPRLSLEPLVQRYGSVSALARALGCDRVQVSRWRKHGMALDTADRVAVAVGHHPWEVWPEWYELGEASAAA